MSLGDFQSKLIDRFSDNSKTGDAFVKVRLENDFWLIDLKEIKEASVPSKVARNAAAPAWIVGIANFKGEVWTVLDMLFLMKRQRTAQVKSGWVTLLKPKNENLLALLWTDLVELVLKEEYHVSPNPPPERFCSRHWIDKDGKVWKELDVSQIYGSEGLIAKWRSVGTDSSEA